MTDTDKRLAVLEAEAEAEREKSIYRSQKMEAAQNVLQSVESRLTRIEASLASSKETFSRLESVISSLGDAIKTSAQEIHGNSVRLEERVRHIETNQIEAKLKTRSEIKMLRIGVSLALLATMGGGGAVVARLFGM